MGTAPPVLLRRRTGFYRILQRGQQESRGFHGDPLVLGIIPVTSLRVSMFDKEMDDRSFDILECVLLTQLHPPPNSVRLLLLHQRLGWLTLPTPRMWVALARCVRTEALHARFRESGPHQMRFCEWRSQRSLEYHERLFESSRLTATERRSLATRVMTRSEAAHPATSPRCTVVVDYSKVST